MDDRSDDTADSHFPTQPVGRVRIAPDVQSPASNPPLERNSLLARVALGVVMLGLTLLGIFVILYGSFLMVPDTVGGHW